MGTMCIHLKSVCVFRSEKKTKVELFICSGSWQEQSLSWPSGPGSLLRISAPHRPQKRLVLPRLNALGTSSRDTGTYLQRERQNWDSKTTGYDFTNDIQTEINRKPKIIKDTVKHRRQKDDWSKDVHGRRSETTNPWLTSCAFPQVWSGWWAWDRPSAWVLLPPDKSSSCPNQPLQGTDLGCILHPGGGTRKGREGIIRQTRNKR